MKKKLLFLLLFSFAISLAKSTENPPTTPSIGVLMFSYYPGNYYLSIKNTGDETLTNVYVTQSFGDSPMTFSFSTIATLAPGEEVTGLTAYSTAICHDISQVTVHATTAGGNEITDLSSDPNNYNNGQIGTYYNDAYTESFYQSYATATQEGIYQDLNNNAIVDVGDAIFYDYNVTSAEFQNNITIFDNNAIVGPVTYSGNYASATGTHYITQNEVTNGYVYNNSFVLYADYCQNSYSMAFIDQSQCYQCPNPNFSNVITKLTDLGPHLITGNVKLNNNNDDCSTGVNIPNRRISSSNGFDTYTTFTKPNGDYRIIVPNITVNNNIVATSGLDGNFTSNPALINLQTYGSPDSIVYNNNNFCVSAVTNVNDLSVCMFNTNNAVPGATANYRIYCSNRGTTNLNGSIQLNFDNNKLTFAASSPSPIVAVGNQLGWSFVNLLPFETRAIDVSFTVATPPIANINNTLNFTVNGNTTVTDDFPANNTFSWTQIIRSSFDPNDKTVIEGQVIDIAQTGNYLHYVTRFQNSGTANATTVVIKENLDPNLDWTTFEPIASSHPAQITLHGGNDLTYTFSNIDLPYESANEAASHGWMAYKIKPKADIALWDIMSSASNIYFDYNPPIATNGVTTQVTALATVDFVRNNFSVYPNPASGYITIEAKVVIESEYEITDVNGKSLLNGTAHSVETINIASLQSGFYFLNLKTDNGKATYKFIKN